MSKVLTPSTAHARALPAHRWRQSTRSHRKAALVYRRSGRSGVGGRTGRRRGSWRGRVAGIACGLQGGQGWLSSGASTGQQGEGCAEDGGGERQRGAAEDTCCVSGSRAAPGPGRAQFHQEEGSSASDAICSALDHLHTPPCRVSACGTARDERRQAENLASVSGRALAG